MMSRHSPRFLYTSWAWWHTWRPQLWRLRQEDSETRGKPRPVIYMKTITQPKKVDEPQDCVEWQMDHTFLTQKRPQGAKAGTVAKRPGAEGNEIYFCRQQCFRRGQRLCSGSVSM